MSDITTFSETQSGRVIDAADHILRNVDFQQFLRDAGVDLAGADSITIELSTGVDEFGTMKKRPGDGKGCLTVCVGWGPAKVCWKNCDD